MIRYKVRESTVFEKAKENKELLRKPVFSLFRQSLVPLLVVVAIAGSLLFVNTATFSLYPTIFESVDNFSRPTTGFWIAIINLVSIGGVILGGVIANRSLKKLIFMKIYVIAFIICDLMIVFIFYIFLFFMICSNQFRRMNASEAFRTTSNIFHLDLLTNA